MVNELVLLIAINSLVETSQHKCVCACLFCYFLFHFFFVGCKFVPSQNENESMLEHSTFLCMENRESKKIQRLTWKISICRMQTPLINMQTVAVCVCVLNMWCGVFSLAIYRRFKRPRVYFNPLKWNMLQVYVCVQSLFALIMAIQIPQHNSNFQLLFVIIHANRRVPLKFAICFYAAPQSRFLFSSSILFDSKKKFLPTIWDEMGR